jgi:hypothetical protein
MGPVSEGLLDSAAVSAPGPHLLELGTRIAPFGDPVGALPLFDATVAELRDREVAHSGVAPERLTFADYAVATHPVLAAFARAAPGGRPAALALPAHPVFEALAAVSSARRAGDRLVYDIFLDAPRGADLETLRAEATPVLVPLVPAVLPRALPRLGPPPHVEPVLMDGAFAAHLEHWVHVLWAAQAWVPALRVHAEGKRRRGSVIGPGADVHPSAYLEGAIIGAGAEIGASCVLRHCYVGPKSRLSDFTKLAHGVLGPETHTLADATFEHMVALGGGTLTNLLLQDSLLGRQVFLTTGVVFWRDALGDTITVQHQGREVDTGRKVLGGCAGHGSILGARTIVAPGRALPNRTTVVMRKAEGVFKVAEVPPGTPMCWSEGALVPVGEVEEGYVAEEVEG